jgi:hypothetical protein
MGPEVISETAAEVRAWLDRTQADKPTDLDAL